MRKAVVITVAFGILGLAVVLVRPQFVTPKVAVVGEPGHSEIVEVSPAAPFEAHDHLATVDSKIASETTEDGRQDLESGFHASPDLWLFAEGLFASARAGDPAAQYYLSRTLKYCEYHFRLYFVRGGRHRTLDEGMQWASTRQGLKTEEAREVHSRCSRLQESSHPFGTADAWLSASKEAGFHLAMIDTARKLAAKAGFSGSREHEEMRKEARRLALRALESRDPQVIFGMGDLATLFVADMKKASQEQWVWRLAACKRGYECGQGAAWLEFQCRFDANCQPYESGVDFLRRTINEDFDEIERRADDLNSRLDAGDFEWLGS